MRDATELRYVGVAATGTDNVDLEYCRRRGVAVCNIRGYCTQSVVEHVLGIMLGLSHNLKRYNLAVRRGEWQKADQFCLLEYRITSYNVCYTKLLRVGRESVQCSLSNTDRSAVTHSGSATCAGRTR